MYLFQLQMGCFFQFDYNVTVLNIDVELKLTCLDIRI